ncbi:MAG: deoxyribodipyrimidine photo-lyase [Myxococcota bacterium]
MGTQLVWFKRDLRLDDHVPLHQALARGPVLGLYIFEPEVLRAPESDPCHWAFVLQSLAELRDAFEARGGRFLVRTGEAVAVLDALHEQTKFDRLWSHEETGLGVTFERDKRVKRWARSLRLPWTEVAQHGVVRPLPKRAGWASRWNKRMQQPAPRAPERIVAPDLSLQTVPLPTLEQLGLSRSAKVGAQPAGSTVGESLVISFLRGRGRNYRFSMSSPNAAWEGCSRLSPHLAYGTVSLRRVYQRLEMRRRTLQETLARGTSERRSVEQFSDSLKAFGERLRWHCHFMQKLESEPAIEFRNMNPAFDGLRTEDAQRWSAVECARFEAWTHGRTGFPMVDACMRCLHETGWINFRMRAMLVSVLAYDLWLHWRPGAQFLARQFVDFEPGIHYAQFQMQSGTTGINSLRIYDPAKQVRDQDPRGAFIRRWVPELEGVPDEHLPLPHRMGSAEQHRAGCIIGRDYPAPVVDHAVATAKARRALERIRRSAGARAQSRAVFGKHGSRRRPADRSWRR